METLLALDHQLFLFINHLPHRAFLDALALGLSGIGAGGLIWFILSVVLFLREEKKDHWFFLPVVVAGAVSFIFVEILVKPFISRPRPGLELGSIIIGQGPGGFSFPSGHATFAFALATVLAAKEPRLKYFFYGLAFLISLSRIYLGKHYPADVVAGALVGWGIGWFALWIEQRFTSHHHKNYKKRKISH